ncbi:MAG: type III-A CRISPR-associated protein Csm2 [Endomicrobia bacterium]|nr:type III-A CRISPR-associated protein Csm2 [Endomicrobiia bacterium]MCL2506289.1 type III-A CRISPR-associated protein Csm2 [Endomicrobiia bacterium]
MADSFFYEGGKLKVNLFSDIAENQAKDISDNKMGPSYTQMRKFFDEVIGYKTQFLANGSLFDEKLPYIKMLNAKFAYSFARAKTTKMSDKCKRFFVDRVNAVNTKDDFMVFADFFEAFMAFYKFHRGDNK